MQNRGEHRYIQEGSGTILVDWNKIPPKDGNYPLTILVASDTFLKDHRDLANKAVKANKQAIDFIQQNPSKAYELISDELKQLTGKGIDPVLIKAAHRSFEINGGYHVGGYQ